MKLHSYILLCSVFLVSCEEFRYPLDSLPKGDVNTSLGDTVYVQQYPIWTGFNEPEDVIVGNEPFVYVADYGNNRVVMLELTGRVVGYSTYIKHPIAIAQDKRLQLIVCAEFDTLLPGNAATTFGAVYRIDLPAVNHLISAATPRRVFIELNDPSRRYTGIATILGNSYYLTRTGPKNELNRIDRDNAILGFASNDSLVTPITAGFSPDGSGLLSIHTVTGIATPPNSKNYDYAFCQIGASALYKVQWIRLVAEGQTTNWVSKFYTSADGAVDILKVNRFENPQGMTFDPSQNLFVVDAAKDSLIRFTSAGAEKYSFGGHGSGELQFDHPSGVAFHEKTLYVSDRNNNRIVRFKLSTDF